MLNNTKTANKKVVSPLIYKFCRPGLKMFLHFVYRPKVYNREFIPKEGSAVLAGNHVFVLDPLCVGTATRRCVHFLGKCELFDTKFKNWLFTQAGVIPVHRHRKDHAALEAAEDYLNAGALIALFPEGTTIKDEGVRILPFKMGAIKMAYDTGCPIVPFTINGKFKPFKKGLSITFHEPYYIESDDLDAEREKLIQIVCSGFNPPLKDGERKFTLDK